MKRRNGWLAPLILAGMAAVAAAADSDRERSAVVQIGGCSGVIVDPAGLVMTAKHCELGEVERVVLGDYKVLAVRVYEAPEIEGPLVYDCVGAGYPWIPVAEQAPGPGERVHTLGYPLIDGARRLREATGVVERGGRFRFRGEYFLGNFTDVPVSEGWSGGPLFNERGEVVGLANAGDRQGSIFISHAATRAAWLAARSLHSTRPLLLIASDLYCRACLEFLSDYADDAGVRREIQEHFRVIIVDVHEHPELIAGRQDPKLPVFIVHDHDVVQGYPGKEELLRKLVPAAAPVETEVQQPQPTAGTYH
jgi:Trypsin-like peptidase domain